MTPDLYPNAEGQAKPERKCTYVSGIAALAAQRMNLHNAKKLPLVELL